MKDRWIALYVENQVGVLAKISGLFAGKSYNLKVMTVGNDRGGGYFQNHHQHSVR